MPKINPRYLLLSDPDFASKVYIAVPRDLVEHITLELMNIGAVEVVPLEEKKDLYEHEYQAISKYFNLLEKAKRIYSEFVQHLEEEVVVEVRASISPDDFKSLVESLVDKLGRVVEDIKGINSVVEGLKSNLAELELLKKLAEDLYRSNPDGDTSLMLYRGREYIVDSFYGSPENMKTLIDIGVGVVHQFSQGQTVVASILFKSRDYERALKMAEGSIRRFTFLEKIGLKSLKEAIEVIDREILELRGSIASLVDKKRELVSKYLEDVAVLKIIIDNEYERVRAIYTALRSRYLSLICGWVPRSKVATILEKLKSRYPVEIVVTHDENPPAEFNNLKPFKPFELLTEMSGAPSKSDWDPTPLFTYAFIFFFSLMMCDIGYSVGLILATRYVLPLFTDNPKSEGFRKLQLILYICGIGGIITGLLSGGFFGDLLGKYIPTHIRVIPSDPGLLIGLSLLIGWIWMVVAHAIAIVKNTVKLRNVYGALNEFAITSLLIVGFLYVLNIMSSRGLRPIYGFINEDLYVFIERNLTYIQATVFAMIALLIVSKVKMMGGVGAMLSIFDITGALGDVFSFIRLAGIALATSMLANVFNQLIYGAAALNIVLGVLMALAVHFFIFALSPISPFVHGLRLCMLEIGSKIYEGQNKRIAPLAPRIPLRVVLTKRTG